MLLCFLAVFCKEQGLTALVSMLFVNTYVSKQTENETSFAFTCIYDTRTIILTLFIVFELKSEEQIGFGSYIRQSIQTFKARVLKFHIWIPHKNS